LLASFTPLFSRRVWRYVPALVVGALLAPGRRMVSTALRSVGLGQVAHFQNYHRVLNRAVWSSRAASRLLLGLLVTTFAPQGPLVLGIDETIERRRGASIAAAGIYRDPIRSSRSSFVKVNGLRWIAVMLLVPLPWANRVWALPFLTALAPSERYAQEHGKRHKPVPIWARQMLRQIHRWYPKRTLVVVGDSAYATLDLLAAVRPIATVVTRLRLDARRFAPAPPPRPYASAPEGPSPPRRRAPANLASASGGHVDALDGAHGRSLVWLGGTRGRDRHRHGRLVFDRAAAGPHPLDAHPRSARPLPHPSASLH
jgi:hypothetical protein